MGNLFILAFDHRASFARDLLGFSYPNLKIAERKKVAALKGIVFAGFLHARRTVTNLNELAILIDEEFGTPIIRQAKRRGLPLAISVEKSGQKIFAFEHGKTFGQHLIRWKPNYAKALVRYDIGRLRDNVIQRGQLKELSEFCKKQGIGLMLEVLLSGKGSQLRQVEQTIKQMRGSGVEPTLWKLEGFHDSQAWQHLRHLSRTDIIVLGRGASKEQVGRWIKVASRSGAASGFAIGRTIFSKPLADYLAKKIDRKGAVLQIAENYLYFINLWHKYANT